MQLVAAVDGHGNHPRPGNHYTCPNGQCRQNWQRQNIETEQGASDEPPLHRFVWLEVLPAAEDAQATVVTAEVLESVVAAAARVAELSMTLRACHMIATRRPLDVRLTVWTLLSVRLSTLLLSRPRLQQFVTLAVLPAGGAIVPRRLTREAPVEVAVSTRDLQTFRLSELRVRIELSGDTAARTRLDARVAVGIDEEPVELALRVVVEPEDDLVAWDVRVAADAAHPDACSAHLRRVVARQAVVACRARAAHTHVQRARLQTDTAFDVTQLADDKRWR